MSLKPFRVVIPVRYASTRLPGKPLLSVHGRSILQYTYQNATESGAVSVTIATDDERIFAHAQGLGADVMMTSRQHQSGTDRIAEVATERGWAEQEIIVNLQGDEPQMAADNIRQVAMLLHEQPAVPMATLCYPIAKEEECTNPNCVKVVFDQRGLALYFSRCAIPYRRDAGNLAAYRHLGIYAYRNGFLKTFAAIPPGRLETIECLEQLRALENGSSIAVAVSMAPPGMGIDTPQDFEQFCRLQEP